MLQGPILVRTAESIVSALVDRVRSNDGDAKLPSRFSDYKFDIKSNQILLLTAVLEYSSLGLYFE